jgi:ribonuclease HI
MIRAPLPERVSHVIYSDGSCLGNPGAGGWAFVVLDREETRVLKSESAGCPHTTNNRMELMAAIVALESLPAHNICLCTDSKYVINGIRKWIGQWKRTGWRRARSQPIANIDLWKRLDTAIAGRHIETCWVKGHSASAWNNLVDKIARERAQEQKTTTIPSNIGYK